MNFVDDDDDDDDYALQSATTSTRIILPLTLQFRH